MERSGQFCRGHRWFGFAVDMAGWFCRGHPWLVLLCFGLSLGFADFHVYNIGLKDGQRTKSCIPFSDLDRLKIQSQTPRRIVSPLIIIEITTPHRSQTPSYGTVRPLSQYLRDGNCRTAVAKETLLSLFGSRLLARKCVLTTQHKTTNARVLRVQRSM